MHSKLILSLFGYSTLIKQALYTMKASFVYKTFAFSILVPASILACTSAQAQNYLDARNFASPNVMVDLTILNQDESTPFFQAVSPEQRIAPPTAYHGTTEHLPSGIRTPNGVITKTMGQNGELQGVEISTSPTISPIDEPLGTVSDDTTFAPPPAEIVLKQELKAIPSPDAPVIKVQEENEATVPVVNTFDETPVVLTNNNEQLPQQVSETANLPSSDREVVNVARSVEIAPPPAIQLTKPQSSQPVKKTTEKPQPLSIAFTAENGDLSDEAATTLDKVIKILKPSVSNRVQIKAFANGTPETANKARRLSLTRALNARTYLLQNGVKPTQIDVRALGIGNAIDKPASDGFGVDRIDFIFMN